MRKVIVLVGFALALVACGSDEPQEAVANTEASSEAASAGEESDSPFVSVPLSELTANHIDPPVSFSHSPAIGGDHYRFWQNCGFYDVEVIEGAAAHTLEHGAVWITYNASAVTSDDVQVLEAMAAGNEKLLISPYPHDEPLVLSAWGVQQRLATSDPNDPSVAAFIDTWQDNPELPEAGVTCLRSVGIAPDQPGVFPDGGEVPAEYR